MSWLALGAGQVLSLWLAAGALALWLYLHHRHPVRRRVSTLRFWVSLPPSRYRRPQWLREPWAFLAQLLFLLLLIVALANPRWGRTAETRRVAIVLDTSIWSQVEPPGESRWIDRARDEASRFMDALPPSDEVLLLQAEADASPVLPFTRDRAALRSATRDLRASSSIADVPRALEAGRVALGGARHGLLVYIGPGMLDEQQTRRLDAFRRTIGPSDSSRDRPQFLIRLVSGSASIENRGITRLALQRDAAQPDHWHLLTQLKNYGQARANVLLKLSGSGTPLGQRALSLAPGELTGVHDEFTWAQGGLLTAEIGPPDPLDADNRAIVRVPSFRPVQVAVFTSRPSFERELRTVLSTNPYVRTQFVRPGASPATLPDVAIYDRVSPTARPTVNSIWFQSGGSSASSQVVRLTGWNAQHPVTRWVRTRDVSVRNPALLEVLPTDTVLASAEGTRRTPLILARERAGQRSLIIGFDPADSNFPQQSAFPLLMAGGVEWMTHTIEDVSGSLAAGELDVPGPATRIIAPSGKDVPFARSGSDVHLLALETGLYRLIGPDRETSLAVSTPPLLPSERLTPTSSESAPVEPEAVPPAGRDLWRWLVALAMVALWAEWLLFYSSRANRRAAVGGRMTVDGEARNPGPTPGPSLQQPEIRDPNFIT
jgi:Aerotolerance regulator N-terminal